MSRILAAALLFTLPQLVLAAYPCKYQRTVERELASEGLTALTIDALAGELRAKGTDSGPISVRATLCSDREKTLEKMDVEVSRTDSTGRIVAIIPGASVSGWNADYATIDLELTLPRSLAVAIHDTSGDIDLGDLTVTSINDSSGRIDVSDSHADLRLEDSSGEIDIRRFVGNLTLSDSSGDIVLREITGTVHIEHDSSGDIDIKDVQGNVVIDRDSSGEIEIEKVEGSVELARDGSGDIELRQVRDNVHIGSDGSGDIRVADVGGDFIVEMKGDGKIRPTRVAGRIDMP